MSPEPHFAVLRASRSSPLVRVPSFQRPLTASFASRTSSAALGFHPPRLKPDGMGRLRLAAADEAATARDATLRLEAKIAHVRQAQSGARLAHAGALCRAKSPEH